MCLWWRRASRPPQRPKQQARRACTRQADAIGTLRCQPAGWGGRHDLLPPSDRRGRARRPPLPKSPADGRKSVPTVFLHHLARASDKVAGKPVATKWGEMGTLICTRCAPGGPTRPARCDASRRVGEGGMICLLPATGEGGRDARPYQRARRTEGNPCQPCSSIASQPPHMSLVAAGVSPAAERERVRTSA